jgi:hypothetical protein
LCSFEKRFTGHKDRNPPKSPQWPTWKLEAVDGVCEMSNDERGIVLC